MVREKGGTGDVMAADWSRMELELGELNGEFVVG